MEHVRKDAPPVLGRTITKCAVTTAFFLGLVMIGVFAWDWVYGGTCFAAIKLSSPLLALSLRLQEDVAVATGWTIAKWVAFGVATGLGGAVAGLVFGALLNSCDHGASTISRKGCGSCDAACCDVWWRDAGAALLGLVVSLVTAALFSATLAMLLGLLLLGFVHAEAHWSLSVSDSVHQYGMYVALGTLGLWFAMRVFYKTRSGWYKHGELLLDDNEGNDVWALL